MSVTQDAYLLAWNPEHYKDGGNAGVRVGVCERLSCNSTKPQPGDRVYLIRLGVDPRGMVARGTVTKGSFEAEDWRDANKSRRYIEFIPEETRPSCASGLVPILLLELLSQGQFKWSALSSEISIPAELAQRLDNLWDAGRGSHSLLQCFNWYITQPDDHINKMKAEYQARVDSVIAIREGRKEIDRDDLVWLWLDSDNGVRKIGAGGQLRDEEFRRNTYFLLASATKIINSPNSATYNDVCSEWKELKKQKLMSGVLWFVINRVFSIASPDQYTTILDNKDCQFLLKQFSQSFELDYPRDKSWIGLNESIKAAMKEAGLPQNAHLDNIFISNLLVKLKEEDKSNGNGTDVSQLQDTKEPIVVNPPSLNCILCGPPGTGKTYNTINKALAILDPDCLGLHRYDESPEARKALKARFDELVKEGRIDFVTFHQSFSYEDFVEGIRAVTGEASQLEYKVEAGVFKRICDEARTSTTSISTGVRSKPRIWKISIDGTGTTETKSYCLEHGEARIGWGYLGDLHGIDEQDNSDYQNLGFNDRSTLRSFSQDMAVGDVLVCIRSAEQIEAVGVVTGDYCFEAPERVPEKVRSDYNHVRSVKWIYRDVGLSILPLNDDTRFTLKTVYQMERFTWGDLLAYLQEHGQQPLETTQPSLKKPPYVLIIDEINRGNVSRIFGELITLIEPSKRAGASEALTTTLPYSKRPFSVPDNLYLIGTMNTADRSLAGLDIALRRRFVFEEMPPRAELLDGVVIEEEGHKVDVGRLLHTLNQRIEVLLDRDHCLGHAYFMPLKAAVKPTMAQLASIFQHQVLPLLQEYFFEDWQRIAWVLNDHRKSRAEAMFLTPPKLDIKTLLGDIAVGGQRQRWCINEKAFTRIEAYALTIEGDKGAQ
ncbi:MAG: AAA family ATPase [Aeromonas veronii]